MQGGAGALEDDVGISPALAGRDCDVSVQAVDDGQNQSANIQRSGRGGDGVCGCNQQTEHSWYASQKAPSVAVTWGRGSHDFLADLGNNAAYPQ